MQIINTGNVGIALKPEVYLYQNRNMELQGAAKPMTM